MPEELQTLENQTAEPSATPRRDYIGLEAPRVPMAPCRC